jgi:hypothetical protein
MISRITQVARHLARPRPNFVHNSSFSAGSSGILTSRIMASPDERQSRTIHTAACLIIGDEVLGGKVRDPNAY